MYEPEMQTDGHFLEEVFKKSRVDIRLCYQRQKCSAGCPVVSSMDILPHQVIHQIQCGRREAALGSKGIWVCASCHTCSVRCPDDVDFAHVMDSLRRIAIRSGIDAGEKDIPVFHRAFLDSIKNTGRIHELSLILRLKLKTKNFLKDLELGWQMLPPLSSRWDGLLPRSRRIRRSKSLNHRLYRRSLGMGSMFG